MADAFIFNYQHRTKRRAAPSSLRLPPVQLIGDGYLAGEFPGGITTLEGIPTAATVRVYLRSTGQFVAETQSKPDGTWSIEGLNTALRYDVIGRKAGHNDVIKANITAVSLSVISWTGGLYPSEEGDELEGSILLLGGKGGYSLQVLGDSPPGITLSLSGNKITASGQATEAGEFTFALLVTAANGASASIPMEVTMSAAPSDPKYADWRLLIHSSADGQQYIGIEHLEFRGEPGGPPLLGGAASANNEFAAQFSAAEAFKASTNFGWGAAGSFPKWIAYKYDEPVSIVEVAFGAPANAFSSPAGSVQAFDVQFSADGGVTWETAWSVPHSGISDNPQGLTVFNRNPTFAQAVLRNRPNTWLRLGETSGVIAVNSGRSPYSGTYSVDASDLTTDGLLVNDTDRAIELAGDPAERLEMEIMTINTGGDWTFGCLLRQDGPAAQGMSGVTGIAQLGFDGQSCPELSSVDQGDGTIKLRVMYSGTSQRFITSKSWPYGEKLSIYLVQENTYASRASLYVNGELVGSANGAWAAYADVSRFGHSKFGGNPQRYPLKGVLDEIQLYQSAMNQARVAELSRVALGSV